MCSQADDPTQHDQPRCLHPLWVRHEGRTRPCGRIAPRSWTDHTGVAQHACVDHEAVRRHRYPASLSEIRAMPAPVLTGREVYEGMD